MQGIIVIFLMTFLICPHTIRHVLVTYLPIMLSSTKELSPTFHSLQLHRLTNLLHVYYEIITNYEWYGFIKQVDTTLPHTIQLTMLFERTPKLHQFEQSIYNCNCHQGNDYASLNDCLMLGPPFLKLSVYHLIMIPCSCLCIYQSYCKSFSACVSSPI